MHPAIDGCIQLRNQYKLTADQVDRIELKVHPLVLELTGKKTPQTGLEGKFSIYYAAALAIAQGVVGEQQFSDRLVRDPALVALRDRVTAIIDPAIKEDQVRIAVALKDGRKLDKFVEHAAGSKDRPMSDADLEAKFTGQAEGVLPPAQTKTLIDLCWQIEKLQGAAELARAATR
jgi:2-methylcitrate dehydratase PrpD